MKPCKHFAKYKGLRQPKCGCLPCWCKYFENNPGKYQAVLRGYEKVGRDDAMKILGEKYVKMLEKVGAHWNTNETRN